MTFPRGEVDSIVEFGKKKAMSDRRLYLEVAYRLNDGHPSEVRVPIATAAMGINEGDTCLILRPMSTWKRFHTKEELIATLDKASRF